MNDNKKRNRANVLQYLCAAIWYILAVYNFIKGTTGVAVVYMAIGSMWLCIAAAFQNRTKKQKQTLDYYNENAEDFFENTFNADMSETRNRFLQLVPEGGKILDWGCGSGRDALAFKEAGYKAEASDASEELCKIATEKTGICVRNEKFQELNLKEHYDGIWACASLLHLDKEELYVAIDKAEHALKPDGIFYASFKYGDKEEERNGRFFTDMNEENFQKLIKRFKKLQVTEMWVTEDVRPDRSEKWLNVLMKNGPLGTGL